MPITPYLSGASYDPELVKAMSEALEGVCRTLKLSDAAVGVRSVLAKRIISLAQRGERSGDRMRQILLREAGVRR